MERKENQSKHSHVAPDGSISYNAPMKFKGRWKKILLGLLLLLIVLAIIAWVGVKRYIDSGALVEMVEQRVREFAGTDISIGAIVLEKGPQVRVTDIRLQYPDDEGLANIRTAVIGFRWHDLPTKRVSRIRIEGASLTLRFTNEGKLDMPILEPSEKREEVEEKPGKRMDIPRVEIINSGVRVLYRELDFSADINRLNFKKQFPSGYHLLATVTFPSMAEKVAVNAELPSDFDLLNGGDLQVEIPRLDLGQTAIFLAQAEIMDSTLPISGFLSGTISHSSRGKVSANFRLDEISYSKLTGVYGSVQASGTFSEKHRKLQFDSSLEVNQMNSGEQIITRQSEKPLNFYADGTLLFHEQNLLIDAIDWRISPMEIAKLARVVLPTQFWLNNDIAGNISFNGIIDSTTEVTVQTSVQNARLNNFHSIYSDLETDLTLTDDRRLQIENTAEIFKVSYGTNRLISNNIDGLEIETNMVFDLSSEEDEIRTVHFNLPDVRLEDFQPYLISTGQGQYQLSGQGQFSGEVNSLGRGIVAGSIKDASFGPYLRTDLDLNINNFWFDEDERKITLSGDIGMKETVASGYRVAPISLNFVAEHSMEDGIVSLQSTTVEVGEREFPVKGTLHTEGDKILDLSFDLPRMEINELADLPKQILNMEIDTPETEGQIDPQITLKVERTGGATEVRVHHRTSFEGMSGTGPEGLLLWSELGGTSSGSVTLGSGDLQFSQELTLDQGEVLYDTLYQNLENSPFEFTFPHGTYGKDGALNFQKAAFTMPGIAQIETSGTVQSASPYPFDMNVEMNASWQEFLSEVIIPWLSGGLDLFKDASGKGSLSFQAHTVGDLNGQAIQGVIESGAEMLAFPNIYSASFSDLEIRLPLRLQLGSGQREISEPVETGTISFGRLWSRYFHVEDVEFPVHIEDNRLNIPKQLVVSLYGGEVVLGALSMENILDKTSRVHGQIEVNDLKLAQLSEVLGLPPMQGGISGDNLEMHSDQGDLELLSPLTIKVFEGTIEVTELKWLDFLGRYPTFQISTEVKDLNLGSLSSELTIGQITGIINGKVRNLRIQYGWPIEFEIDMKTVKKSGVSQRVSSDAVKTMLMVDPRTLEQQAIRQVLERTDLFYYDKIGFHASLHRNVFKLVGTIEKGDEDFLMLGAGWRPLNIKVLGGKQGMYFKEYVQSLTRHIESIRSEEMEE